MSLLNKLIINLIYLNAAILLLPDKLKPILIFLLFISVIFRYFKLKKKPVLQNRKYVASILFFIILVVSCFYSQDTFNAVKKVETSLSLIIFPTIFYFIAGDKEIINYKTLTIVKKVFIFSVLTFLLISFSYFFATEPYYTFKSTLVHYSNLVNIRVSMYLIHPIYLSIFVGVAIIFCLQIINESNSKKNRLFIISLLLLIVFMAILSKKGPILSFIPLGIFFLLKNTNKKVYYLIPFFLILIVSIIYLPKYKGINNFVELNNLVNNQNEQNSSTGIRLQIYDCSIEQIIKSPVFGYGIGDASNVLNECYEKKNPILLEKNYNSHNQFLSIYLSTGIIGFVAFIYFLVFIIKVANKKDTQILFLLVLYFCFNMFTENILEREDGVILVSFLLSLYLFDNKQVIYD
jgi:O-antigen ligase